MIILGIDPGPEYCGVVIYDNAMQVVLGTSASRPVDEVLFNIMFHAPRDSDSVPETVDLVAIERVQSYGIAGSSLLRTSEVVGRLWQQAKLYEIPVLLLYRREILRFLDVTGKGNRDSLVRQRMIEMHGGTRQAAQGVKKNPGPLYGVSGHAWQALAVAIAAKGMPV